MVIFIAKSSLTPIPVKTASSVICAVRSNSIWIEWRKWIALRSGSGLE